MAENRIRGTPGKAAPDGGQAASSPVAYMDRMGTILTSAGA